MTLTLKRCFKNEWFASASSEIELCFTIKKRNVLYQNFTASLSVNIDNEELEVIYQFNFTIANNTPLDEEIEKCIGVPVTGFARWNKKNVGKKLLLNTKLNIC